MGKVDIAIARLREASAMSFKIYGMPLIVTDSGGKDSSVCVHLAQKAGIQFEVMHNNTTADAPETMYFVRKKFKQLEADGIKCTINYPVYKGNRTSMWSLIPQKLLPPMRNRRYCCEVLKERCGDGRFIVTGVRWAESEKRKNGRGIYETMASDKSKKVILNNDNDDRRRLFENCRLQAKRVCNPIIDWTDADVWNYINSERLPLNQLYQCGFSRVGCVGCPLARTKERQKEFARYPIYRNNYIRSFDRMLQERKRKGKTQGTWDRDATTGEDVFHWWMEDGVLPGQMNIFDE